MTPVDSYFWVQLLMTVLNMGSRLMASFITAYFGAFFAYKFMQRNSQPPPSKCTHKKKLIINSTSGIYHKKLMFNKRK